MSFGGNNDSFGCIGPQCENSFQMDIDDNDIINDNPHIQQIDYEDHLIRNKIDASLEILSNIFLMKHNQFSLQALLSLPYKNNQSVSEYEVYKSSIILHKIQRNIQTLIDFYYNKQRHLLHNKFILWKRKSHVIMIYDKTKSAIENNLFKIYNNKRIDAEKLINLKQKDIDKVKDRINDLNNTITQCNKNIKTNDEKENIIMKNIKGLQEDNKHFEEDIKRNGKITITTTNSTTNTLGNINDNDNGNKKNRLEARIGELELTVKSLEDDLKEKDNEIINFVKESNEMLDYYEKMIENEMALKVPSSNNTTTNTNANNHHNMINSSGKSKEKWKSPNNPRTSTFKNSFNVLPNTSSTSNNNNHSNTTNSINSNITQTQLRFINPNAPTTTTTTTATPAVAICSSKTGHKLHSTITSKASTNTHQYQSNNNSNTTRGLFINIATNKK